MKFRRLIPVAALLAIAASCGADAGAQQPAAPVSLTVQVDRPLHPISPLLYGIFLEDINFGADGGLNAELVKNGGFEFPSSLMGWKCTSPEGGPRACAVLNDSPRRATNPTFLRLSLRDDGQTCRVENEGFRGMGVHEGETYRFTAWARSEAGRQVMLIVGVIDHGGQTLAEEKIELRGSDWHDISAVLKPVRTDGLARLELSFEGPGLVDLDMVSLCPEKTWKERPHGLRADLVQLLADLEPAFFRFPGGCIVEGPQLKYRYDWKTTLGDLADRRLLFNRWNSEFRHRLTPDYFQSFAVGFYEYFLLSEEIGAEPLPILNCGMACQFNSGELVPLEELGPYIQDALDLIEFANGPVTSTWGAKRAALGHPEPFGLRMVGIGNEQWDQQYIDRYREFAKVLKERHPEIQLVSGAGPFPNDPRFHFAWAQLRALDADIIDEHSYAMPDWFLKSAERYDGYDRNGPKVFMGEYAAQSVDITAPDNRNNQRCALAEAAFLTGIERNSDVVVMSAYAPLLGHEDAWQWRPNLIWFDSLRSYPTPNYYVQQLFSRHRGDTALPVKLTDGRSPDGPHGRIGLATFHSSAEFNDVRVTRDGRALFTGDQFDDLADATAFHGNWSVDDGVFRQSQPGGDGRLLFGDHSWADYTLSLKARKLDGEEGFIVIVRNTEGGSFLEWILGGWGNREHGIHAHLASHSTDSNIVARAPGSIEEGRWYDVRIELRGAEVKCYLDDELMHSVEIAPPALPRVYATASRDDDSGELVLKVVNCGDEDTLVRLHMDGTDARRWQANPIVLAGDPDDVNTLTERDKISPRHEPARSIASGDSYTFPAHSVTVLRLTDAGRRRAADKPLFRDPVFDGAADPVVIWNQAERKWYMFYTNRRANLPEPEIDGVNWVHGTNIGIAESENGARWKYVGTAEIELGDAAAAFGADNATFWAPDVVYSSGSYHMFLTVVPGVFRDWNHPRSIVHLTCLDLRNWQYESTIKLASDRVIDATIVRLAEGGWRMWYNNEADKKSIYYAESDDLITWRDRGKARLPNFPGGEGPKVFFWDNWYWMVLDVWDGLAVYRSGDAVDWTRQPENLLQLPGKGADDGVKGQHADVVVMGDEAYLFYFTHPGRTEGARNQGYDHRRSSIQVAELKQEEGVLTCDRDAPVRINLRFTSGSQIHDPSAILKDGNVDRCSTPGGR